MAIFSLSALCGNGYGPLIAGWIEMNSRLGWRWIQWIQLMYVKLARFHSQPNHKNHNSIFSVTLLLVFIFLEETRSTVLLMRIAKKLREETGRSYKARIEDESVSLKHLIWISCTRPIRKFYFFFFMM